MEIDVLASELNNSISTNGELRCGEYAFKLKMNPWQHPIFNKNIHRLLVLLTALCHGCGGVIYLLTDDTQPVTEEIFHFYKGRLNEVLGSHLKSFSLPINMVPICLALGAHRSWAALLLKRCNVTLIYPPLEKHIVLDIDIFGQIHTRVVPGTQTQHRNEQQLNIF